MADPFCLCGLYNLKTPAFHSTVQRERWQYGAGEGLNFNNTNMDFTMFNLVYRISTSDASVIIYTCTCKHSSVSAAFLRTDDSAGRHSSQQNNYPVQQVCFVVRLQTHSQTLFPRSRKQQQRDSFSVLRIDVTIYPCDLVQKDTTK